jgi:hypothetical protein
MQALYQTFLIRQRTSINLRAVSERGNPIRDDVSVDGMTKLVSIRYRRTGTISSYQNMAYSVSHDRLRLNRQSHTKPCKLT